MPAVFAPSLDTSAVQACRAIAVDPGAAWMPEAEATWPGPMAHEYHRLRRVLEEGQVVAAIFQLKDFAEVCIRFPALVLASDVLAHGRRSDREQVRRVLDGRPLAMGQWLQLLRDVLVPASRASADDLAFPELANLFLTRPSDRRSATLTPWARLLEDLCQWRNDTLAHGPFRLDVGEYVSAIRRHVKGINVGVGEQVVSGAWATIGLHSDDEAIGALTGWESIVRHHALDADRHGINEVRLRLARTGKSLDLWPLMALWRCPQCGSRDVFMYDGRRGWSGARKARMIDYFAGHSLIVAPHYFTELYIHDGAVDVAQPADDGELVADFTQIELEGQLEQLALQSRYLEPTFLRETCVSFVEERESGILWLRGSEGVGKSVFTANLAMREGDERVPLPSDVAVATLHLRRGRTGWIRQLREFLEWDVLRRLLGVGARAKDTPRLDIDAPEPRGEFARVLRESLALASPPRRLLLCIDGLDELWSTSNDEGHIAAFIPFASELPSGCYLLLTSRAMDESPEVVRRHMSVHPVAGPGYVVVDLDADALTAGSGGWTSAYLALLRDYFDRDVRPRVEEELHAALTRCAGDAGVTWVDDLSSGGANAWSRTASEMWKSLTSALHSPIETPGDGRRRNLQGEVVFPLLERVDHVFALLLEKSRGRFAYLAHLTRMVASRGLSPQMLGAIPEGEGMSDYFLAQLQLVLADTSGEIDPNEAASKRWEFTRHLLLMLIAAEDVYTQEQLGELSPWPEPGFRGIDLASLADLLNEPSAGSLRLLFALSALKDVLSVWKGDGATSPSYAVGLPGLAQRVRERWGGELARVHQAIAAGTLERLAEREPGAVEGDAVLRWRVQHAAHHATLSGDAELLDRAVANEALASALTSMASAAHGQVDHPRAHALGAVAMQLAETAAAREETVPALLHAASTHRLLVAILNDAGWRHHAARHAHRAAMISTRARELSPDDWMVHHFTSVDNLNFASCLLELGDRTNAAALVELEQEVVGAALGDSLQGARRNPGEGCSEETGVDWVRIQQTVQLLSGVFETQGQVAAAGGDHQGAADAFRTADALLWDLLQERHTPEQAYQFIQAQQRLKGLRLVQLRLLDDGEAERDAEELQAVLEMNDRSLSALPLPPDDLLRLLERRLNDSNDAYRSGAYRAAEAGYSEVLERLGAATFGSDAASSFRGAVLRGETHRGRALVREKLSESLSIDMSEAILSDLNDAIRILGALAEHAGSWQGMEPRVVETLALGQMNRASVLAGRARHADAVTDYERAMAHWNALLRQRERIDVLETYRLLRRSTVECARVLTALGETVRALELLSRVAEYHEGMSNATGAPLSDREEYSLVIHELVVASYTSEAGDTDVAVRRFQQAAEHAFKLVARGMYEATEEWLDGEAWALVALVKRERWNDVPAALWRTAQVLEELIRSHPESQAIEKAPWFEQAHGLPNVIVQLSPEVRQDVQSQFTDDEWRRVLQAFFFVSVQMRARTSGEPADGEGA